MNKQKQAFMFNWIKAYYFVLLGPALLVIWGHVKPPYNKR